MAPASWWDNPDGDGPTLLIFFAFIADPCRQSEINYAEQMVQSPTSAQRQHVGYWTVLWQNVLKIFLIDLLGAAIVVCATSVLAVLFFAIARTVWVLQFRPVTKSLVLLATIYLAVILVTAMKRHYSLGIAIKPILDPQPEVNNTNPAPVVDAGIPTSVS